MSDKSLISKTENSDIWTNSDNLSSFKPLHRNQKCQLFHLWGEAPAKLEGELASAEVEPPCPECGHFIPHHPQGPHSDGACWAMGRATWAGPGEGG